MARRPRKKGMIALILVLAVVVALSIKFKDKIVPMLQKIPVIGTWFKEGGN
jgi:hypothetical protein